MGAKGGAAGKGGRTMSAGGIGGSLGGAGDGGSIGGAGDGGTSGVGGTPRGCDSPTTWSSNLVGCDGEYVHRPSADACTPSPREPDGAGGQAGAGGITSVPYGCATDADCTDAPDGYCITVFQSSPECVYSCRTDADCGENELCACDDSHHRPSSSTPIAIGLCTPAYCRTDADCGAGSLCISALAGACAQDRVGRPDEFHCQSSKDECSGRGDCASQAGAPNEPASYFYSCHYDVNVSYYRCGSPSGC